MSKNKDIPVFERGELDRVRNNLGKMDESEAKRMAKVLGGVVGVEKSSPSKGVVNKAPSRKNPTLSKNPTHQNQDNNDSIKIMQKTTLPVLTTIEHKGFYNLLLEYDIAKRASIFSIIFSFGKVRATHLSSHFVKRIIPANIKHINTFIDVIQKLINNASSEYKQRVLREDHPFFKTFCTIYTWNTLRLLELSKELDNNPAPTIEDSIPIIKELFRYIMRFYLLGEARMVEAIKKLYTDIAEQKSENNSKNMALAKTAASEWVYIFEHIIHRFYPLLMRLTSTQLQAYPDFYSISSQKIFPFLDITKYDIITLKKKEDFLNTGSKKDVKVETNDSNKLPPIPASILQSLSVLNTLFPSAGWGNLERKPDMYQYFQPIYNFNDGYSLLSPENPLQLTTVLLKILEDFFQGFRTNKLENLPISFPHANYFKEGDSLEKLISEWTDYTEVVCNKILFSELREYTYHVDSQMDFAKSKFGRKQITNWLWQVKYVFHPHLEFDITYLDRSGQILQHEPLSKRIRYATQTLTTLIKEAEKSEILQSETTSQPYRFDVENSISYRLNLLLENPKINQKTNLNLMKFTLHALRVLDWWLNDKNSYAYLEPNVTPYRTTGKDLLLSPLRSNQKELFLALVKKRNDDYKQQATHEQGQPNAVPESSNTQKVM